MASSEKSLLLIAFDLMCFLIFSFFSPLNNFLFFFHEKEKIEFQTRKENFPLD